MANTVRKTDQSAIVDLVLGKLPPEKAAEILDEIEKDPKLSAELELVLTLHEVSQQDGAQLFGPKVQTKWTFFEALKLRSVSFGWAIWCRKMTYVTICLVIITSLLLPLYWMGPYRDTLARPESIWISWTSQRSPINTDLSVAQMMVSDGKVADAMRILERHMRAHPNDPLIDQIRYNLVVLRLFSSRRTVLGIWYANDINQVLLAASSLDSISSNQISPALLCRVRYLHAKALLAIGRDGEAIQELKSLCMSDNEMRNEALNLLKEISAE